VILEVRLRQFTHYVEVDRVAGEENTSVYLARPSISQLNKLAVQQPVLMVFEDLHWVDPTSLELLSLSVGRIPDQPILLLATARPEFTPPCSSHRHTSTISLTRLGRSEVTALVAGLTQGKSLSSEVRAGLIIVQANAPAD
jgi:predicted ATPase